MSQSVKEVADALANHCRTQTEAEALNTLYHPDAVSVEAMAMPGSDGAETKGLEGIRGKHAWWDANFEVHGGAVEGPFMHGDDRFGLIFRLDATNKQTGERSNMEEIAVYHVSDGKITREEFFYTGS
ncbi:nuclear transport factor 2 family protein [Actibacterium sp. 188UL27-1]|uniref:nuclear transport factor 2 family protein n=1 Tax=Actibacterium sp. 188UL27-1 TaxID=2786961 RepID=UPI00195E81FC|nr:nuclear transport factor 2 family protein [Actibacterium sp. 188UL27-1]MBM7067729.1 nuclear transport factor 2 family protein [Actibacterium sp. 188UL27-1]